MTINKFYVLTFEYFDKSGSYICGITQQYTVALAWIRAGEGQHRVYDMELDDIADHTAGHKPWNTGSKSS